MKTNLNREIKNSQDASIYLTELFNNDEYYHPEDDAFNVIWEGVDINELDKYKLNSLMNQVYNVADFDPCELIYDLIHN